VPLLDKRGIELELSKVISDEISPGSSPEQDSKSPEQRSRSPEQDSRSMDQRSRSNNEYIDPEEMREIELGKHMVMAYVIQVML